MTPAELDALLTDLAGGLEGAHASLANGLALMLVAAEHDADARVIARDALRRSRVAMLGLLSLINNAERVLNHG